MKNIVVFILAVALSFVAAGYRWGDSAHSIGVIKARGGEVKHPSAMDPGHDGYTLVSTATVIPPYSGDARVELEGEPKMDYRLALQGPAVDLGLRRHPELSGNVLTDLRPMDRVALWVVMTPPVTDPVCGMAVDAGSVSVSYGGRAYRFCSSGCRDVFIKEPARYKDAKFNGMYRLAFYDTKTGDKVLTVPVKIGRKGGRPDACENH